MQYKKIYLEITNNCNLNCDFCIKNKRKIKYISIEEFNTVLNKIKTYTNYLYFHILGEPLMHKDINELINIANSKGFNVNITTNGYLIERIKENKNIRQINISLHSFNERYHVEIDKYLENIFETIDILIQSKTYISLRLWVKNKYHKYIINKINMHYNVDVTEDVNNYKINNYLFINNFHEFIWPDLNNNTYEKQGICYALKEHIGILVDGTIVPCCLDTLGIINLGNIYHDNLDNIITSKRYQNMLNEFKKHTKCEELCRHCKFIDK